MNCGNQTKTWPELDAFTDLSLDSSTLSNITWLFRAHRNLLKIYTFARISRIFEWNSFFVSTLPLFLNVGFCPLVKLNFSQFLFFSAVCSLPSKATGCSLMHLSVTERTKCTDVIFLQFIFHNFLSEITLRFTKIEFFRNERNFFLPSTDLPNELQKTQSQKKLFSEVPFII